MTVRPPSQDPQKRREQEAEERKQAEGGADARKPEGPGGPLPDAVVEGEPPQDEGDINGDEQKHPRTGMDFWKRGQTD